LREIEVKVLDINKEEIKDKLINIGAKLVKDEYQYNYIFDTEERYLKSNYNGYLRIRKTISKEGKEKINLTLKRNIPNKKIRENIENSIVIDNVEEGMKILEVLGYKLINKGTKHRKSYKYSKFLFEIDEWDKKTYPKPYLEIEVKKEKDLEEALEILNIDKEKTTNKSIEELREDI